MDSRPQLETGKSEKTRRLELGEQTPSQVEAGWVLKIGPGNLKVQALPLLWWMCGSEDRCGGHRGPAGWGVLAAVSFSG